jgi:hypothetical protein
MHRYGFENHARKVRDISSDVDDYESDEQESDEDLANEEEEYKSGDDSKDEESCNMEDDDEDEDIDLAEKKLLSDIDQFITFNEEYIERFNQNKKQMQVLVNSRVTTFAAPASTSTGRIPDNAASKILKL